MGGDNFKTYNTSAAVSSQSATKKAVSKSPGSPFNPQSSSSSVASLTHFVPPCCHSAFSETTLICSASWELYKSAGHCFSLSDTWTRSKERSRAELTTAGNRRSHSIHLSYVYLSSDRGCSLFHLCFYSLCCYRGH